MKNLLIYTFSLIIIVTAGCSKDKIPGVYRIDIQQGNDITQEMVNKLEPGMTKNQVAYVMGTPLIIDTFHPDRWDYVYSFHPGNGQRQQRRVTVFFIQDKLDYIEGNTTVVAKEDIPQINRTGTNVVVPLTEESEGLIDDLKNTIGLGEDAKPEEHDAEEAEPVEVPVPNQDSGLFGGLIGSNTDATESTVEEENSEASQDEDSPGLYNRFKNSIGLGE